MSSVNHHRSPLKLLVVSALAALATATSSCGALATKVDPERQLFAAYKTEGGNMAEPSLALFDDTGKELGAIKLPKRQEWLQIAAGPGGKLLLLASKNRGDRKTGKMPNYSIAAVDTKNLKVTSVRDFEGEYGQFGPVCQASLVYGSYGRSTQQTYSFRTGKETTAHVIPLNSFDPPQSTLSGMNIYTPVLCLGDRMIVLIFHRPRHTENAQTIKEYDISSPGSVGAPRSSKVLVERRTVTRPKEGLRSFTPSADEESFFAIDSRFVSSQGAIAHYLVKIGPGGELWRKQIPGENGHSHRLSLGSDNDGRIQVLREWYMPRVGGIADSSENKDKTKSELLTYDSSTGSKLYSTTISYGPAGQLVFAPDGTLYAFNGKAICKFGFGKKDATVTKVKLPLKFVNPVPVLR